MKEAKKTQAEPMLGLPQARPQTLESPQTQKGPCDEYSPPDAPLSKHTAGPSNTDNPEADFLSMDTIQSLQHWMIPPPHHHPSTPSETYPFYHVCHALMCRSAALQGAPRQKSYDLLLPFYWGPSDEPYDLAKPGAMLLKVKNRTTKTSTQELSHEAFLAAASVAKTGSGGFPNSRPKLLYILLDLGIPGAKVQVHPGPEIWTIHCVGHRKDVFGCRKMGVAFPAKKVFAEIMEGANDDDGIDVRHDADLVGNVLDCDWENAKKGERAMAIKRGAKEVVERSCEPKLEKRRCN